MTKVLYLLYSNINIAIYSNKSLRISIIIKIFFYVSKQTQWFEFGGKCGPCGDKYDDPHPQDNENTGKFGRGLVSAQYTAGSVINVTVLLTANHMGEFTYSLCVLRNESLPETDDDCFQSLRFADGANAYAVSSTDYNILNKIQLPPNLTCDRCVLRWHYTAGRAN